MRTSGKRGAGHDRNIGAAHDFEQAQGVRYFFIAPRSPLTTVMPSTSTCGDWISSSERLHVAAAGAGAVFVDDDFAAGLRGAEGG